MPRMFEGLFTEGGMVTTPSLGLGDIESTVKFYSDKYGIDYDLVSALIQQESSGNPSAVSGVGAVGLMQIMPSTAQNIATELGEPYTSESHKDPETNIRWGTYHLKTLLDRFGGDELKALAAYHAGEGAVSKAEKEGKRIPDTYDPTAGISTKDYVKQVLGRKGKEVSYKELSGGRMFAGLFEGIEFPEKKEEVPRETQPPTEMVRTEEGLRKGATLEEVSAEQFGKPGLEEKIVGGLIDFATGKPKIEPAPAETTRVSPTYREEKPLPEEKKSIWGKLVGEAKKFQIARQEEHDELIKRGAFLQQARDRFATQGRKPPNWADPKQMRKEDKFAYNYYVHMTTFEPATAVLSGFAGGFIPFSEGLKTTIQKTAEAEHPIAATTGKLTGIVGASALGAGAVSNVLSKIPVVKASPIILETLTRVGAATAISAGQQDWKNNFKESLRNTLVSGGAGFVSVIPEIFGPPNAWQLVLQPMADVFYDAAIAKAEGKQVLSKQFLKENALNWFLAEGFAIKDVASGAEFKIKQKGQRQEIKQWLKGKGKIEVLARETGELVTTKEGITVRKEFAEKGLPEALKGIQETTEGELKLQKEIAQAKEAGAKAEPMKPEEKPIVVAAETKYDPVTGKEYPVDVLKKAQDIALKKVGGEVTKGNEDKYDKILTTELAKYEPVPPTEEAAKPKEVKIEKLTPEEELRKRVRETKPPPKKKEFEHFRKVIEEGKSPTVQPENMAEELGTKKPFIEPDKIKGEGGFVIIPDAKDIKTGVAKIAGLVSTETPYKLAGAPETGRAVKLLNSRLSVADENALDFVRKGAADIQPRKTTVTVERSIGGTKLEGAREEVDVDLSEDAIVFFSTANPKHLEKVAPEHRPRLQKVVDTFNKMNKKYETELKEMDVLERGWPESAIKRNNERIESLKREMVSKKKRPVKKIVDEINQLTEDNEALGEMKYMHFPARIWLADKYDNDPDAFRTILSGSFKGIKGRKTIDPFELVEAGVLDPSKVSAKEAMAVYMRYVDSQKAQVAIRDMAIAEKVAIKTGDAPSDYIDMGSKYPLFEGYKVHPMIGENLANTFDLVGARQGTVEKIMAVTKMLQFYNPVIMPMYDTFQAAAVTQGRFLRPKHFKKAVIDVIKKTPSYYEAADNGLYSKPFKNTFSNFKKELERIKESKTIKDAIKFEFKRLKENPARALADIYTASWNTAWFGDKILRMASYNVLRNQGLSPRDAAKFAAEAHADYAGVPAKTRKALNKVLFTPTFQISMLKWHAKMFLSAIRAPVSTVGRITGHPIGKTAGKDWIRAASFASAVGMLMAMDYGLRKGLGWTREEFGRKYKKNIKYKDDKGNEIEEQVVVTLSNPINVPLKYYYTFVKPKPGMTKSEQIAKYGKYWLHPLLKLGLELSNNKRPNGDPIANPWTSPERKLIDTNRYIAANIFSMYRGLIDEPENTKREALAKLRKAGDNPFNQMLGPIAFLYTRQAENKRIATRAQRVLVDFNRALVDRPPRTKKELETMYNNLNKVLDGLEKGAIDFETKRIVLQSQAKTMRDSLILKFFYEKKGELSGEDIKGILKKEQ